MNAVEALTIDTPNGPHRVRTSGDGEPLVVLPGGPGYGATYLIESMVSTVGASRQLVFIDQRGSGGSPPGSGPLSMEAYVEDTLAVTDAMGFGQYDVLGHSFGGLQALQVATSAPDRVQRVILLDSAAPTQELSAAALGPDGVIAQRTTPEDVAEIESITSEPNWMYDQDLFDRWVVVSYRAWYSDPTMSARVPHDMDGDGFHQLEQTMQTVLSALGDWDYSSLLAELQQPTLVINCRESILGPDTPAAYEALLKNATVEWVDGGHTPPLEDPSGFTRAMQAFYAGTP